MKSSLMKLFCGQLCDNVDEKIAFQDWPRLLSLGEQQRLAFARLLLNAPRYAVAQQRELNCGRCDDVNGKLKSFLE